jgi:hypothetical protein
MAAKRIGLVMNVWRIHCGDRRDGIRDGRRGRSMVVEGNLCCRVVFGRENHPRSRSPKDQRFEPNLNPIFLLIPEPG